MSFATADLYDQYEEQLMIVSPMFNNYGGNSSFCGYVSTVKAFEDNSLVRAALEEPADERVLVVDGAGSLRCAMLGDMLVELGVKNNWAGIVVYGCIRDSVALARMPIGVKALNTNPRKSVKRGLGDRDVTVCFADATIAAGDYLYADEDGIMLAKEKLG